MKTFLRKSSVKLINFSNGCFNLLSADDENNRPNELWVKTVALGSIQREASTSIMGCNA